MAEHPSNTPPVDFTAAWVKHIGDGNLTLGRMIQEAFPDEESLYQSQGDPSSQQASKPKDIKQPYKPAVPNEKDKSFEDSHNPESRFSGPNFTNFVARIRENMTLDSIVHPWGIPDYNQLMKFVNANPLDAQKVGLLVITDASCRFIAYDDIYDVTAKDCPPDPKVIFARIPLFNEKEGMIGKGRYILAYDINSERISVRHFENPPVDISEIGGYWHEGKDIYLFDLEEIYDFIRCSVDENDGKMVFPRITRSGNYLDGAPQDHPGLQLVVLGQCANFMVGVSRVLLLREKENAGIGKHRAGLLRTLKRWQDIAEFASVDMWAAYRAGTCKEEYVRKININRAISDFLGFEPEKAPQTAPWVNPNLLVPGPASSSSSDSCNSPEKGWKGRKCEEEAINRVEERFSHVFEEPTEEERSNWKEAGALDATANKDIGDKAKGPAPAKESLPAKLIRSFRGKSADDSVKHTPAKSGTGLVDQKSLNDNRSSTTATPGSSEHTAAEGDGENGNGPKERRDRSFSRPPVTGLSALLDCILRFVNEHPQMNNASNRIKCRTMLADMGVTIMERRHRSLEVVAHPYDGRVRGPEEHALDIAEMEFDVESNAGEEYSV